MHNCLKDDFDYIGRKSKLSSSEMCAGLLGLNCAKTITKNLNWTVPLPSMITEKATANGLHKPQTFSFLQITDVHADLQYLANSNANCGYPVCCRQNDANVLPTDKAGYWGDYRRCDTPLSTVRNALKRISDAHPNVSLDWNIFEIIRNIIN